MKKTNRILSMLLAIIMVICMLPISTLTSSAANTRSGELTVGSKFYYYGLWYECDEVLSAGRISYLLKVTSPQDNTVYSGDYTIPSAFPYNNAHCIVTGIAADAFANSDVTGVHMEQTWRYYTIEHDAFLNCTSLTEVAFGKSFRAGETEASINDNAFSGCTALEHIVIPPSVENIGMFVFKNCTNLKTVVYEYPYVNSRIVSDYAYDNANPTVTTRYLMPENPRWEGTTATWDALSTSYVRYEVQFSGTAAGGNEFLTKSFYTTGTGIELSEYSEAPGTYSFTVKAIEPEIVFANLKVDGSDSANSGILTVGGIEISNVNAVRTGSGTVELTFDSTSDGSLYYLATQLESIDGPNTNGAGIACLKGNNSIILTEIPDEPLYLEIRLKNSNGMQSELVRLELSEYVVPSVSVGTTILYDGEYTANGIDKTTIAPTSGGYAYFKDGVLTLNNFTYSGGGDENAAIYTVEDLRIQVLGNNEIYSENWDGIFAENNLEIYGGGTLTVANTTPQGMETTHVAIRAWKGSLSIKNVTLNCQGGSRGISCNTNLTLDGVTADVRTKGDDCLYGGSSVSITDSILQLQSDSTCIGSSWGDIEITNSTVEANGNLAINVNPNHNINLVSGTYKLSGTHDNGAIYVQNSTLALPEADYWWRTAADTAFTKSATQAFNYNGQKYVEFTTIEPHTHNYTYEANDNIITESCTCGHSETATIVVPSGETVYDGYEHKAKIEYSNGWIGNKDYQLEYLKNGNAPANFKDAGEYSVKLTIDNAVADASYTVKKKTLTVTARNHQITYGDEPVGAGVDIDGFVPGEDENYLGGELNYDFTYIRYDDIGDNYKIEPRGYDSDNYTFKYEKGTLEVKPLEVEIKWSTLLKGDLVYDGQTKVLIAEVENIVRDDEVTVEVECIGDNTNVTDDGFYYKVKSLTGSKSGNYKLSDSEEVSPTYTIVACNSDSGEHEFTVPQKDDADHWNKCSNCDAIDLKIKHSGGTATCTAKAKCEVCDTEYGKLLGHKYEWVIDKEPTAAEEGSKHEECTVCKAKQNENTAISKIEESSPQTGDSITLCILLVFIIGVGAIAFAAVKKIKV